MTETSEVVHMTAVVNPQLTKALRWAAVQATCAPSIHNTQPWRIVLDADSLEIHADWSRHLKALDAPGRQLLISCGCAVFNARVALAAAGYGTVVERLADPGRSDLVARIVIDASHGPDDALVVLDPAIDLREINRGQFSDEAVPADVMTALVSAANAEGTDAVSVTRPEDRQVIAELSELADQMENVDPAYRAELRAWTTDDLRRDDGVLRSATSRLDAGNDDGLPIRDFDAKEMGWLSSRIHSGVNECLLMIGSRDDTRLAWLRAGEALERLLLEIARRGFAVSPLTQLIEVPRTRVMLRRQLGLSMHPQVLLRIGRAPGTHSTRRRRLVDVITEAAPSE